MGRFDQYVTGKLEIKIGNENLELDVRISDKRIFKGLVGKDMTEDKLKVIDEAIVNILKRSYPSESPEALEAFYTKNDVEFLNELLIAFGWLKREDINSKK